MKKHKQIEYMLNTFSDKFYEISNHLWDTHNSIYQILGKNIELPLDNLLTKSEYN